MPDLARSSRAWVGEALTQAWGHYSDGPLHNQGVAYLARRGIDVSVLEAHNLRVEVGHTPKQATDLVERLRSSGFSDDGAVDSGLAHRSPGRRLFDFYRDRALIPLRDDGGQIVGLIGRNVGDQRWPKYKNPPRTCLYDKSLNLYRPLSAPDPDGQVVVVEGTLDAMAIAVVALGAGLGSKFCPVTQSGRELSPAQLDQVLALHPYPPIIAFDGDNAGRESNARLARALVSRSIRPHVVNLPEGADPASWLAKVGVSGLASWTRPEPPIRPSFRAITTTNTSPTAPAVYTPTPEM